MTTTFKKVCMKYAPYVASLMFLIGIGSCAQACCWWFAQPKVPQRLDEYMNEQ